MQPIDQRVVGQILANARDHMQQYGHVKHALFADPEHPESSAGCLVATLDWERRQLGATHGEFVEACWQVQQTVPEYAGKPREAFFHVVPGRHIHQYNNRSDVTTEDLILTLKRAEHAHEID